MQLKHWLIDTYVFSYLIFSLLNWQVSDYGYITDYFSFWCMQNLNILQIKLALVSTQQIRKWFQSKIGRTKWNYKWLRFKSSALIENWPNGKWLTCRTNECIGRNFSLYKILTKRSLHTSGFTLHIFYLFWHLNYCWSISPQKGYSNCYKSNYKSGCFGV